MTCRGVKVGGWGWGAEYQTRALGNNSSPLAGVQLYSPFPEPTIQLPTILQEYDQRASNLPKQKLPFMSDTYSHSNCHSDKLLFCNVSWLQVTVRSVVLEESVVPEESVGSAV